MGWNLIKFGWCYKIDINIEFVYLINKDPQDFSFKIFVDVNPK